MDIEIICNTEDAELLGNISANSRTHANWLKLVPEHDGHAVIVGGGPSLKENLRLIEKRHGLGQTIFALNGTAAFLNKNGIMPDYQVILDARPENVLFISDAKKYLIASQCHPSLLEELPQAVLWHPDIGNIVDCLPDHEGGYVLIGGGTTVGLSSMCLAYAMGYRKLHLYGFDSSHRDTSGHAYRQPMNDRDPLCKVTLGGKVFTSSLTMARQAERFPQVSNDLIDRGCTITVDGDGLIQAVLQEMQAGVISETEKYRRMWEVPGYRACAPGEIEADAFIAISNPSKTDTVIDFGCGTGRGAKRVRDVAQCNVLQVDFADNCRDGDNELPFALCDLTKPMQVRGTIGYCTDVMEHIPADQVSEVISNIMACVDSCYFRIALYPDNMGALIGQQLHLSVFSANWWADRLSRYEILHRHDGDGHFPSAVFYVRNKPAALAA